MFVLFHWTNNMSPKGMAGVGRPAVPLNRPLAMIGSPPSWWMDPTWCCRQSILVCHGFAMAIFVFFPFGEASVGNQGLLCPRCWAPGTLKSLDTSSPSPTSKLWTCAQPIGALLVKWWLVSLHTIVGPERNLYTIETQQIQFELNQRCPPWWVETSEFASRFYWQVEKTISHLDAAISPQLHLRYMKPLGSKG